MLFYMFRRIRRSPGQAIGVLLLAVIVSAVLCGLHRADFEEQKRYEEVYHTIPVTVTVTSLSGAQSDHLKAPGYVADVFTGKNGFTPNYSGDVVDVQIQSSHAIAKINGRAGNADMIGITSFDMTKELLPENGVAITWAKGADESIFAGAEPFCLVPNSLSSLETIEAEFSYARRDGNDMVTTEHTVTFRVAGFYTGKEENVLFCPYLVMEEIYSQLGQEKVIDSLTARLKDNEKLEEFKGKRSFWFAEPNLSGEPTQWGVLSETYPTALDINDDQLQKAAQVLASSIFRNRLFTTILFVLSATAGFLVGFLIIRSRKREIMLLRTIGTPNAAVLGGFALEQMLFLLIGTIAGGVGFFWQPVIRLVLFVGIYASGLMTAFIIFLRANLLTTIKEDE